ncbi:hypothetical protein ABEF95_006658 [Exophiala dermatitidis]
MAILNNVEITVSSDGKPVQEYQPPTDDREALKACSPFPNSPIVVKYIEATPGAHFQIEYQVTGDQQFGRADALALYTDIDGKALRSPIVSKETYGFSKGHSSSRFTAIKKGAETGYGSQTMLSLFYRRELSRTGQESDGTMADLKKKYGDVGTIIVKVMRVRRGQKLATAAFLPQFEREIPEKVLKGQSVDTGAHLGQPKPSEAGDVYSGEQVDKEPCAVLIFLYRSKKALQTLDVIPRSPSPIPLEERDPDTLTREEAVELLRRQRAEAEAAKKVQIKKKESEEDLRKSAIKREATDESDDEVVMIAPPERKKARKDQTVIELSD